VRFVFIDDSARSTSDVPRAGLGSLHAYGAVVVPQEALAPFTETLTALRTRLGLPPKTEFKWNQGQGPLHKQWDKQKCAREMMLTRALDLGVTAVVVVCATDRMPTWDEGKIKVEMLTYLYERISMLLSYDDECGVLIADHPPGDRRDEKRWLAQTLELTEQGTRYVQADPARILLPVLATRSDHVDLLQLADLVTAAVTALVAGSQHAMPYRRLLVQLLARNKLGYVGGTGLKLVPDLQTNPQNLLNLLHWVLDEDVYIRVSTNDPVPLPHHAWSYSSGNGLNGEAVTRAQAL
jgi:hypothetical protein